MTAVDTHLGWTLIGKYQAPGAEIEILNKGTAMIVTSIFVNEFAIKELSQATMQYFRQIVSRELDGIYIAQLPWIEGYPDISTNYFSALFLGLIVLLGSKN